MEVVRVCVCLSWPCVAVTTPPSPLFLSGMGLLRQNVAGRQSGRVTEHIKTHTHTHIYARSVCSAIPLGACHMPTPSVKAQMEPHPQRM